MFSVFSIPAHYQHLHGDLRNNIHLYSLCLQSFPKSLKSKLNEPQEIIHNTRLLRTMSLTIPKHILYPQINCLYSRVI